MNEPLIEEVSLDGRFVRLEPLRDHHAVGLAAVADVVEMQYLPMLPEQWDLGGFRAYVRHLRFQPTTQAFAVVSTADDRIVGVTAFLNIRPEHRGIEIGHTWLYPDVHGTAVNPEMKRLMLAHAFETQLFRKGPAVRVELRTDVRNERSQRAIEKLGATREGVLRRHHILNNGYIRDTVVYSVLETEWPAVKRRLAERIDEKRAHHHKDALR